MEEYEIELVRDSVVEYITEVAPDVAEYMWENDLDPENDEDMADAVIDVVEELNTFTDDEFNRLIDEVYTRYHLMLCVKKGLIEQMENGNYRATALGRSIGL